MTSTTPIVRISQLQTETLATISPDTTRTWFVIVNADAMRTRRINLDTLLKYFAEILGRTPTWISAQTRGGLTINGSNSATIFLGNTVIFSDNVTLSVAQSAYVQANSGFSQANGAYSKANIAFSVAGSGYNNSNSAYNNANSSFNTANSAYNNANSAYRNANSAYNQANNAYNQANVGLYTATSAFSQANIAYNQANSAFSRANQAITVTTSNGIVTSTNSITLGSTIKISQNIFSSVIGTQNQIVVSNSSGIFTVSLDQNARAYPKAVGGTNLNFNWVANTAQPNYIWGGNNGQDMYIFNPAALNVNYANRSNISNYIDAANNTSHPTVTGALGVGGIYNGSGFYSKIDFYSGISPSTYSRSLIVDNSGILSFNNGTTSLLKVDDTGNLWTNSYGWLQDHFFPYSGGKITGALEVSGQVAPQIRMRNSSFGRVSFYDGDIDPDGGIYNYTMDMDSGRFALTFSKTNIPYDYGAEAFRFSSDGQIWTSKYGFLDSYFASKLNNPIITGPLTIGGIYEGEIGEEAGGGYYARIDFLSGSNPSVYGASLFYDDLAFAFTSNYGGGAFGEIISNGQIWTSKYGYLENYFVAKAGDTMTGTLRVPDLIVGSIPEGYEPGETMTRIVLKSDNLTNELFLDDGMFGFGGTDYTGGPNGGSWNPLFFTIQDGSLWSKRYGWLHDAFLSKSGGTMTGALEVSGQVAPQIRMRRSSGGQISFYDGDIDPDGGIYNYTLNMDSTAFRFAFSTTNVPYNYGTEKFVFNSDGSIWTAKYGDLSTYFSKSGSTANQIAELTILPTQESDNDSPTPSQDLINAIRFPNAGSIQNGGFSLVLEHDVGLCVLNGVGYTGKSGSTGFDPVFWTDYSGNIWGKAYGGYLQNHFVAKGGDTVTGQITFQQTPVISLAGGAYSYLAFRDDESVNGLKYIHCNSNVIGFLGGDGGWIQYTTADGSIWSRKYGWLTDQFLSKSGGTMTGALEFNSGNNNLLPQIRMRGASAGRVSYYDELDPDYGVWNYTINMDGGDTDAAFRFAFSTVNSPYDYGAESVRLYRNGQIWTSKYGFLENYFGTKDGGNYTIISGYASVYSYTNDFAFHDGANYFDLFPPSGKSMSNLVAFSASIRYIHFAGDVDQNDAMRCTYTYYGDRIRVWVQNTEQNAKPSANWLSVWS